MVKIIKYYRKSNYGTTLEYIHPDNAKEMGLIIGLTHQKTINCFVRSLIENLTDKQIQFEEVIAP